MIVEGKGKGVVRESRINRVWRSGVLSRKAKGGGRYRGGALFPPRAVAAFYPGGEGFIATLQKKLIYTRQNKLKMVQRNRLIMVQRNKLM